MLFRKKERSHLQYQRSPPKGNFPSQEKNPWTCPTDNVRKPGDDSWPPSERHPSGRILPLSARTASRSTSPRPRPGSEDGGRPPSPWSFLLFHKTLVQFVASLVVSVSFLPLNTPLLLCSLYREHSGVRSVASESTELVARTTLFLFFLNRWPGSHSALRDRRGET